MKVSHSNPQNDIKKGNSALPSITYIKIKTILHMKISPSSMVRPVVMVLHDFAKCPFLIPLSS
jgi:hypothetical protein